MDAEKSIGQIRLGYMLNAHRGKSLVNRILMNGPTLMEEYKQALDNMERTVIRLSELVEKRNNAGPENPTIPTCGTTCESVEHINGQPVWYGEIGTYGNDQGNSSQGN